MDKQAHILVVDDDREIRDLVAKFLKQHNLRVTTAQDGREMKRAIEDWAIDLVVLDVMMPGEDGLTLCRNLRASSNLPVIMLTAMGEDTDRIIGLEMGADDYIAKPFNPRELLARIKAVLRRTGAMQEAPVDENVECFRFNGWEFKPDQRELLNEEAVLVSLSRGEFELLDTFVRHPNRVLNRDQLLDMARGREAIPFDRAIDVQVSRLRKKLKDDPKNPATIKTVRGGGYMFSAKVEK
ncbi:Transcriptional regulatory protein OmpR [Candidatus Terasakiella magnetica]|uniref:Regulatory protein VirG n=1 Tax=Candidatus Terasakiella magnetica TaxID=1867952 RepID=A0A1C3RI55_9PROT|nr:response regulator [Candidatus Terasakiella magnetica]SCA56946.1 Transcriptional regulatory protein OmpR [Candidatus Terasakiella magnetica]